MPQNRWINELVKYDFSVEYQKGKNNTVANALSQIQEERLSDQEVGKLLEDIPRNHTVTPASVLPSGKWM